MRSSDYPPDPTPARRHRFLVLAVACLLLAGLLGVGLVSYRFGFVLSSLNPSQDQGGSPTDEELQQRVTELGGLGYLSGYEAAPQETGVLIYDPSRAYDGYNFFTSGHSPEAVLMDMQGKPLHRWRLAYYEGWPVFDLEHKDPKEGNPDYWRRAHLFENGDVLAIFDGLALLKVDRHSNPIWAYRGGFHHDLEVQPDGRIFVLTHREINGHPSLPGHDRLMEDFITILNADGAVIRHVSILEAFVRSDYAGLLERVRVPVDVFHTNTVEVLKGGLEDRCEAFGAGNVLVSLREIDVVAVVDLDQEKVVWAMAGDWVMQHQPTMLAGGTMLLFDNQGHNGASKVIEFDPLTGKTVWSYAGNEQNGFNSPVLGSNQRLPGGNTLITESSAGRAFEVAPDGAIVWEYVDSKRIGPVGQWQLIPTMCEMLRIERQYVSGWLEEG